LRNRDFGWIFQVFSIICGGVAISSIGFAAFSTVPPYVVGENLVLMQLHLVPGFYIKPITLFTYSFFLAFTFGLYSPPSRRRIALLPSAVRRFFYVISWFVLMASGFEVIYHMVLWSAALSIQGLQNPDIIVNLWPHLEYPINVVFSIKLIVMIFAISIVVIDYIRRIEKNSSRC
jgi:hypothetical protein